MKESSSTSVRWQLESDVAERYERILVPAILGPFAEALVDRCNIKAGDTVVDIGCGTGAAARHAVRLVGPGGRVTAVDVNAAMLEVARSSSLSGPGTPIEWRENTAYELALSDASIDVAVCAQTLQFLTDRRRALSEMYRVLKPGGRLAVSVWCSLNENVYFEALVDCVSRHLGANVAAGLKAAFNLADRNELLSLVTAAGFRNIALSAAELVLALPELMEFVPQHISATPMAAGFDQAEALQQDAIVREMDVRLAGLKTDQGVQVPFRSHIVLAEK